MAQNGTWADPTEPHTPQENCVAERSRCTIFGRVRATFYTLEMGFDQFWGWSALDTIVKHNSTWKKTTESIPRMDWEENNRPQSPLSVVGMNLPRLPMFGEYAHIPQLQKVSKLEPIDIAVRCTFADGADNFGVIRPETGQLLGSLAVNHWA